MFKSANASKYGNVGVRVVRVDIFVVFNVSENVRVNVCQMLSAVLFELEPFVAKGTTPRSGLSVCGLVSVSGTLLHKFLVAKVALKR